MSFRLVALDFSRELARLTEGFTGRDWLFARLSELVEQRTEQLILLTGEPGIGKSSLAARLLTVRKDVAAHHFCFARRVATITPGTVIRSLAAQLCTSLPAFNLALLESIKPWQLELNVNIQIKNAAPGAVSTGVNIQNISITNPDDELELLLRAPLATMNTPEQAAVIVIDALDEALTYKGSPHLVELLAKLDGLPSWLTLFCTARRSDSVLSHLQPLQPVVLDAGSVENLADVSDYVDRRASNPPISDRLQQSGNGKEAFIERITKRAAGNFLYAAIVLDDIAAGRLRADQFEELPKGLDAVYAGFLRRIPDADWRAQFKSILGKLAVAQEPLTEDQLAAFSGIDPSTVRSALGTLDQYLSISEADGNAVSFELFHESLRDFLLAKNRAGRYWCNSAEEHGAIADYYLADLKAHGVSREPYAIQYLPLHLSQSGKSDALIRQLSDYTWLKTKLEKTSVYDLLADFRLAARQPPIEEIESIVRLSTFALERDAGQLWNQFYSRSLERAGSLLRNFPAFPEGPWIRLRHPSVRQSGDPLKWEFHGHTDLVKDIRAVPKSALVVSCSFDRTIRIWDLDSGREVRRITGHTDDVNSVAVSPAGDQIITGSDDLTVRIWDIHSGREIARIDQLPVTPEPVVLSPDGEYMAGVLAGSPSYHDDIWIWESAGRTLVTKIHTKKSINNITFIPQSTWIAGRGRNHVLVWDIHTGEIVRQYVHGGSDGFPNPAIAASPDGRHLASGGTEEGARIKLFRLADDTVLVLPKSEGIMRSLAFSPDGKRLLAAARPGQLLPDDNVLDDSVDLWDIESRTRVARYPHDGLVQAITFSSDGALGVCATGNAKVSVWQLGRHASETDKHSAHVIKAIVRHPPGKPARAFTASIDGSVRVWNLETLKVERILRSSLPLTAMEVNPDGSSVFTAGFEKTWIEGDDVFSRQLLMHRVNSNRKPAELLWKIGDDEQYPTILLLPDQRHAFLTRWDRNYLGESSGFVELWDLERGNRLISVDNQKEYIRVAVPLEGGRKAMTVSRRLCVWTLSDLKAGPRVIAEREYRMSAIGVSGDGRFAVIGGGGTIEVWDLPTLKQLAEFAAPNSGIHDVCFVGLTDLVACAGADHSVRIWDWKQSAQQCVFYGDSAVTSIAWSQAQRTLVAGEESGRVHFLRFEETDFHHSSLSFPGRGR